MVLAATHCGSGCTVGELLGEALLLAVPSTLFGSGLLTGWMLDFAFAFAIGIALDALSDARRQPREGTGRRAESRHDLAVRLAGGIYGWMAIATFGLFEGWLDQTGPAFWFMMQLTMLAGLATALPVNAWLIRRGIKKIMQTLRTLAGNRRCGPTTDNSDRRLPTRRAPARNRYGTIHVRRGW